MYEFLGTTRRYEDDGTEWIGVRYVHKETQAIVTWWYKND